ncbi:rhodanese-like domain-containing protein [Chitinophaga sp. Hz27]|uniref:rhodanese-like domain-containing protein n=1 Tax=Chitinophaga sp. Hz27 TaxID=3347169 RepID=UPI0035E2E7BF
MKNYLLLVVVLFLFQGKLQSQAKQDPWTAAQLIQPETLAKSITDKKEVVILSVGPGALIKGSVDMGPASDEANLDKLKKYVSKLPKSKEIVIYCGCCPFDKCPNIRPAFKALQEMGYKNAKLLNLTKNIKMNWLDKHYPTND